jgi:uncharacterized SAM-binding protein YcdF (DUF218 family)
MDHYTETSITVKKMDSHVHALAERIWRYHLMNHQLKKADAILVLCSHDMRVAETGARLLLEGWAPLIIFSGGLGTITREIWSEPEADQFAKIARDMGVPEARILIENRSTNTGENISFTKILLTEKGINPESFILVQKPYMERRSYATFRKLWPEKEVIVTSPRVSLDEYLDKYANSELTGDDVINIMVGDLQRIKVYSEKGFQIQQEIPKDVWSAYEELVEAGFTKRLIQT